MRMYRNSYRLAGGTCWVVTVGVSKLESGRIFAHTTITVVRPDGDHHWYEFNDSYAALSVLRMVRSHGQRLSVEFI